MINREMFKNIIYAAFIGVQPYSVGLTHTVDTFHDLINKATTL